VGSALGIGEGKPKTIIDDLGEIGYDVQAATRALLRLGGEQIPQAAAVVQKRGQQSASQFGVGQIAVMDRIDAGETVPAMEDAAGYQDMNPEQRREARAQAEAARDAFDPGSVKDSAFFRLGDRGGQGCRRCASRSRAPQGFAARADRGGLRQHRRISPGSASPPAARQAPTSWRRFSASRTSSTAPRRRGYPKRRLWMSRRRARLQVRNCRAVHRPHPEDRPARRERPAHGICQEYRRGFRGGVFRGERQPVRSELRRAAVQRRARRFRRGSCCGSAVGHVGGHLQRHAPDDRATRRDDWTWSACSGP
jgi:hypothetical protein